MQSHVTGAAFFALALSCAAIAQVNARLTGSVVDPSGAAVPGASVEVFLPGGAKPIQSMSTTADGIFAFTSVPAGQYDVSVTANGFRKAVQRGVTLQAGEETPISVKLEVGGTTEVVEVNASTEVVQTTNSEIATNVNRTQVRDLPILSRSPQGFVTTQAGVNLSRGGDTVINGQRTTFTNVTLDGINIQDNYIRTNAVDFSPNLLLVDQVEEITISTSNTNPSAGGGASQVMFVTPSGHNTFHGGAFWSNRNSALAANTWFNNQSGVKRPFLNQNQTGGYLGGPIRKDKLFFYFNYEAFRLKQQSAQTRTILTADAAQGIFTYLAGGAVQKVNILQATGLKIDPTVAALIAKIPAPSAINTFNAGDSTATLLRNTGGYLFNQRSNRTRNNVTGKVDYNMSPKSSFAVTYAWNSDLLDRPDVQSVGYSTVPLVANDDKVSLLSTSWRYNPKPNLTNEVRFGFNRAPALFISTEDFGNAIIGSTIFSTPVATFRSQGRYTNTYNFADNASYVRGAHSVSFGFQMQRDYTEPYNDAGITGTYNVGISTASTLGLGNAQLPGASSSDITAANSLLATLAGVLSTDTQTYNVSSKSSGFVPGQTQDRHWEFTDYSAYIQDTWRAFPHLTVNMGLRYEYYSPVKEQNGLVLLPKLVNGNAISTLLGNSTLDFASDARLYNSDKNNFGPNIGLAWDVKGDGKTALRAGYSLNYVNDEMLVALTGNANTNAGLSQTVTAQGLTSLISAGLPAIAKPVFTVPRTFQDNYNLSATTNFGMADPNLRTPYVQQWNVGVQHEVKGGIIVEARYVGNHGVKLLRALDFNQVNINAGGFLGDFLRAQSNGNLALAKSGVFNPAYDATIAGSQVLTVFPLMPGGGNLTNATNRTYLQQGAVADMAFNYQSTKANGPINFMPNPYAASLRLMENFSHSTYNGLQLEFRTREHKGLTLQGSYTFSKALTDSAAGSDNNNQGRFEPLMDNANPGLAKARALFDIPHALKANFIYRLPMGEGHRLSFRPIDRALLSGWQASGIFYRQSGYPYSVCSGIGTFNRNNVLASNECNTVNTSLTGSQLADVMQFRMTGNGPYMVAASAVGADGRAANPGAAPFSGQVFTIPAAGTIGTLAQRYFTGPWDTSFDFGVDKITRIGERHEIVLRMDSTNLLNHPAFVMGDQTVSSTTFGKITSTFNARRQIQFTLQYRF
ncbi:MAG TPA: TonB-dependent receptor [Candidatus Limnocylindrales bacterium]|nr:TonB-dependent receptor [Candidatus Limnocylindrales bacterium]